ncbi:MAG: hypothetical protein AB9833_05620 [Bacteroidales bacterium]
MGNLTLTYLPPQNWQDFEKFLRGLVDVIWKQEGWQNYGRPGQDQSGIDLYGYDDKRKFSGIQCKKKTLTNPDGILLTNSLLTGKMIEEEILSAESIDNPKIERLIFATTSSRDTKVQDIIRAINDKRIKAKKFVVDIWFWEDLQVQIENHIELMYWYYSELLEKIHKYDKNIHIITMLRQAFTRPAFSREIRREESGADFIHAIKNTQEAITTGRLYNRRGDLIATSYDYQKITNNDWKILIREIYNDLDKIRLLYQDGLIDKSIREHPTCLEIFDDRLSFQFNTLRKDCLVKMNIVLQAAKLDKIDSELIHNDR